MSVITKRQCFPVSLCSQTLFMPESKDVLVEHAHSHTPIIQFFKLPCCKVQTVQPLTACDQAQAASPQEKVPFTWPYLLHSLRQAGPQQLLCFLFQLLLKCLLFMSCKIFLSSLCHLLFLFFSFHFHLILYKTQNCIAKLFL